MADEFLRHGKYQPSPCMDVWAFGQLMLHLLGGSRPKAHLDILTSPAYQQGCAEADPAASQGVRAHFEYLAGITSNAAYVDQVTC